MCFMAGELMSVGTSGHNAVLCYVLHTCQLCAKVAL